VTGAIGGEVGRSLLFDTVVQVNGLLDLLELSVVRDVDFSVFIRRHNELAEVGNLQSYLCTASNYTRRRTDIHIRRDVLIWRIGEDGSTQFSFLFLLL